MIPKHASNTIRSILSTHIKRHSRTHRTTLLSPSFPVHPHPLSSSNIISSSFASFPTESEYHNVADHTMDTIQDTLDNYFEDNPHLDTPDINYSAGVLTIALTKGTWVLNKQTPNEQIWWSSPMSGPRRYEFEEGGGKKWIWSRFVESQKSDASTSTSTSTSASASAEKGVWKETKYLGEALKKELVEMYKVEDGLDDLDEL